VRRRIRARGRPEEQKVPIPYLRRLTELYERWIAGYQHSPVLVIESDRMDYGTDLLDRLDLLEVIGSHLQARA
jgi:deoxyadenosine/deoxycytidine kinase